MNIKQKRRRTKKKSMLPLMMALSCILLLSIIGVIAYKNIDVIEAQIAIWQAQLNDKDAAAPVESVDNAVDVPSEPEPVEEPQQPAPNEDVVEQEEPITVQSGYIEGQPAPTEPTYINGIMLVNKQYPLPATYAVGEDATTRAAYEQMAAAALAAGFQLEAFSGYRSYAYQKTLYENYVQRDGQEAADRYSARPGHSEHQSGLAFDIGEKGREDVWLTAEFGETPAGQWLAQNAHLYGFILRYPKDKEHITGFMYESWHFRYVGVEVATQIFEQNITLEEYLDVVPKQQ